MRRLSHRSKLLAIAFLLCGCASAAAVQAGDRHYARHYGVTCREHQYGYPDLFYNYFVPPTCGGMGAELYPAPLPVPAHVGHTYYTYQPFMPHEFLYKHHRTYHRYYDEGRGLTRTSVRWW
jgi:hypothetical protein